MFLLNFADSLFYFISTSEMAMFARKILKQKSQMTGAGKFSINMHGKLEQISIYGVFISCNY